MKRKVSIMDYGFIPLSVPNLKGNELKYVSHAIETEWVSTGGAYVGDFEKNIADYVGATGGVACQNGTSGLHIALKICGVKSSDEVIVPTLTFIATVNPVRYLGAFPVFMDCDDYLTLDSNKLKNFCEQECKMINDHLVNKTTKRIVRALVVVHIFGGIANMEALMPIAEKYNIKVVEDATEALGGYYTEGVYKNCYAGTIGDVGVYSFNGNKIITTGGGGMIVSKNGELLQNARHLTTQAKSDELYYFHDEIGYNYRMSNLQAALGLAQLEQLEDFIRIKSSNYELYKNGLNAIQGLKILDYRPGIRPNYWFYALYCEAPYKRTRDELIIYLQEEHIQTRPIWGLIHQQLPYRKAQAYNIEKALDFWQHVVNLPCSSNLTEAEVKHVIEAIVR